MSRDRLLKVVKEFLDKVPSIKEPEFQDFFVADFDKYKGLRGELWPKWSAKKGIYYFLSDYSEVLYVGEATSRNGVVYRARENIERFEKSHLKEKTVKRVEKSGLNEETIKRLKESGLSKKTTRVGAVLLDHSDYYWALALERFLIDSLKPPLNDPIRQW